MLLPCQVGIYAGRGVCYLEIEYECEAFQQKKVCPNILYTNATVREHTTRAETSQNSTFRHGHCPGTHRKAGMARNEARNKSQREKKKAIESTIVVGLPLSHCSCSSDWRPLKCNITVKRPRESVWEDSTSKTGLAEHEAQVNSTRESPLRKDSMTCRASVPFTRPYIILPYCGAIGAFHYHRNPGEPHWKCVAADSMGNCFEHRISASGPPCTTSIVENVGVHQGDLARL